MKEGLEINNWLLNLKIFSVNIFFIIVIEKQYLCKAASNIQVQLEIYS